VSPQETSCRSTAAPKRDLSAGIEATAPGDWGSRRPRLVHRITERLGQLVDPVCGKEQSLRPYRVLLAEIVIGDALAEIFFCSSRMP
jgi:hypothetical protein